MSNQKESPQYILSNVDNYKKNIHNTGQEILNKFIDIIIDYMKIMTEKITMKKKSYYLFIFERGIETLIHVFSMIYFYTKNLELTFYHSQKAYYFYIEFIEQISDDNVTFLQLSSRDAVLFVYKKTIYEINNEYKKNIGKPTPEEDEILEMSKLYMQTYKKIMHYFLHHSDFLYENKKEIINTYCEKIQALSNNLNKTKIKLNCVKCIYSFVELLINSQIKVYDFYVVFEDFIKRIQNRKKTTEEINLINATNIINKIHNCDINKYLDENELLSLNQYIFS
jgi:hypothetical protein